MVVFPSSFHEGEVGVQTGFHVGNHNYFFDDHDPATDDFENDLDSPSLWKVSSGTAFGVVDDMGAVGGDADTNQEVVEEDNATVGHINWSHEKNERE